MIHFELLLQYDNWPGYSRLHDHVIQGHVTGFQQPPNSDFSRPMTPNLTSAVTSIPIPPFLSLSAVRLSRNLNLFWPRLHCEAYRTFRGFSVRRKPLQKNIDPATKEAIDEKRKKLSGGISFSFSQLTSTSLFLLLNFSVFVLSIFPLHSLLVSSAICQTTKSNLKSPNSPNLSVFSVQASTNSYLEFQNLVSLLSYRRRSLLLWAFRAIGN